MSRPPVAPAPDRESPVISQTAVSRRRLLGAVLAVASVIILLALMSYDWRDISWLYNSPSEGVPMNRIGKLGAWLTFFGYGFAGLAYRYLALPLLVILSIMLLHGRVPRFRLRCLELFLLYAVGACLFQTAGGDGGANLPILADLNLRPNAGGALGQWLITDLLSPILGTLGIRLFLWALAITLLTLIVGVRNCVLLAVRLTTPRTPVPQTDEIDDLRDTLRRGTRARSRIASDTPTADIDATCNADGDAAQRAPRFFGLEHLTRLFRRPSTRPLTPEEELRETLRRGAEARRRMAPAAAQSNPWSDAAPAPAETPLFDTEPTQIPTQDPESEPRHTRPNRTTEPQSTPISTPRPIPEPDAGETFSLSSDTVGSLPHVSPDRSVTAPVPAGHDNTQPELPDFTPYDFPPLSLLQTCPRLADDALDTDRSIAAINDVFAQFDFDARVVRFVRGPVLTQYEIQVAPNIQLKKIHTLENNFLASLQAERIRIQTPIPGRDVVGIEVPNAVRQTVTLRELLEGDTWAKAEKKMALPLALGKKATGGDLIVDLAKLPHLLVAGGTGSGKSVSVNDMIVGLLMCRKPDRLRLIMIDPKRVEFSTYDGLPHLLIPVVVEPQRVVFALRWGKLEMERRYEELRRYGTRNIGEYNDLVDHPRPDRMTPPDKLPYVVIVIDELADLMVDSDIKAKIEPPIISLTQKARAAGIHLIIATQRPTTNIVTGTIKANVPGRLALRVAQVNDSRTILDEGGAENLIGNGDMLFGNGGSVKVRSQAALVKDDEITGICDYIRERSPSAYDTTLTSTMDKIKGSGTSSDYRTMLQNLIPEEDRVDTPEQPPTPAYGATPAHSGTAEDPATEALYEQALEMIRQTGRFSTSSLQRKLGIGYPKAARISDLLVVRGIVSATGKAGGSRDILVDLNAEDRAALAGTDGESSAFDTRTSATEPDAMLDAPSALPVSEAPTDTAESVAEPSLPNDATDAPAAFSNEDNGNDDDFEWGSFNPDSLDLPNVIHPKSSDR